jgi:hypothetical protein
VKAHFTAWDINKDGTLSSDELDKAIDDPTVKGPAAAAAVALRRGIRMNAKTAPVTLDRLSAKTVEDDPETGKSVSYDSMYKAALKHIDGAKRELFASGAPHAETLAQGRLGDCFLIAPLGTTAAMKPTLLKDMVKVLPDGKLSVHFGNGKNVTIDAPTDGEIAMGASTSNDGIWANVFEKAIGEVYLERQKTPKHVTPFSIVNAGGTPHSPLALFTGHGFKRVACQPFQKHPDIADRAAQLDDVRKQLEDAFKSGKLVVGGTGDKSAGQVIVPGLYYDHSYGVWGYDRKTDMVHFWNPMGNNYKPVGEPGLKNGYVTTHGRFDVPLSEAVMWFGSFSIETDEAAAE